MITTGGIPVLFLIGTSSNPVYGKDFLSFQNTDVGISGDLTTAGVTALGFLYSTYIADGAATVAVDGGAPTPLVAMGRPSFIGFTSTAPITDLSISFPTGYSFDLTSVSYGTASDLPVGGVPELANWAMLVGGFGLVGGAVRRRAHGSIAVTA